MEKKKTLFISHKSTEDAVAEMLVDYFTGTGIPKEMVFCSGLAGSDVNEKISDEIKKALKSSVVNIVILSEDYYKSAFCLNEAGIIWYEEVPIILIALPEINENNMQGLLGNDYILRRLDRDTDVSKIYDIVSKAVSLSTVENSVITSENKKLRKRYDEFLKKRETTQTKDVKSISSSLSLIITDDEKVVLYYMLQKKTRRANKSEIVKWIMENEIKDVNIENAFDLLSSLSNGMASDDTIELGIETFREFSFIAAVLYPQLHKCVEAHQKLAVDKFKLLWSENKIDSDMMLFLAYIIEERVRTFGDRWMAKDQIRNIMEWENKNSIDSSLSKNYGTSLEFLVNNDLVYASEWTKYGNEREYTLYPSLQQYLFGRPVEITNETDKIKDLHYQDLPF